MSKPVFKDCAKCSEPVHRNQKVACKACGAPSPWILTDPKHVPTNEEIAAAGPKLITTENTDVQHAVEALREAGVPEPYVVMRADELPRPLTLVEAEPIDLNPTERDVAAYIHDITTPARMAEAEAELLRSGPHVFLQKFSAMIGNTFAHFKINDVVTDFPLLQELKAQEAPMVPVAAAPGMGCCPNCKTVFKLPDPKQPAKRAG